MLLRWSAKSAVLWLFIASLLGCSNRLATYPVTGQVVFSDGSPVHVGTVELKSREHNIHARGEIDLEGRFVLTTYQPGDGAVAGTHDCVVVQMVVVEEIPGYRPSTDGVVHPRFSSYATSKLVVEVSDQHRNAPRLEVEPLVTPSEPAGGNSPKHPHTHAHHHGRTARQSQ